MNHTTHLQSQDGVKKLKDMVEEIGMCLFCTNLKTNDGATCRPMSPQEVDYEGNLWFFSDVRSDKNREIAMDNAVQLFFAHPPKSSYMVVNGEAEIIIDRNRTEELWSPAIKIWFSQGKDDPNISIIKVHTKSAYYWDGEGGTMVNFFKMLASVATGTTLANGKEGSISV
jgi:general stress protein 26